MGKIIFSTNNRIFSRLIQWMTGSTVSHCAFQLNKHTITHSTFQAGVTFDTLDFFKKHNDIIAVFEVSDLYYRNAAELFNKSRNKSYGYFDIIYKAIAIPLKRLIKFKNPIQDGYICSEYVSLYIDKCCNTKLNSSSYPPTPEDLLLWCCDNLKKSTI